MQIALRLVAFDLIGGIICRLVALDAATLSRGAGYGFQVIDVREWISPCPEQCETLLTDQATRLVCTQADFKVINLQRLGASLPILLSDHHMDWRDEATADPLPFLLREVAQTLGFAGPNLTPSPLDRCQSALLVHAAIQQGLGLRGCFDRTIARLNRTGLECAKMRTDDKHPLTSRVQAGTFALSEPHVGRLLHRRLNLRPAARVSRPD